MQAIQEFGMDVIEDVVEVPLTQGQVAIIDREDWELVKKYNWQAQYNSKTQSYYAIGYASIVNGKMIRHFMHRLIMSAPSGLQVDHINHNTLDNRKSNLRLCSNGQNQHNTRIRSDNSSGYKGVKKHGDRWRADIGFNKKRYFLGLFETPELAYEAYCLAAAKFHGEFANFDYSEILCVPHKENYEAQPVISWSRKKRINNTSGYAGVTKYKNLWLSQIKFLRKTYYLGLYETPEQASQVYEQAAAIRRSLGPETSHFDFKAAIAPLRGLRGAAQPDLSDSRKVVAAYAAL